MLVMNLNGFAKMGPMLLTALATPLLMIVPPPCS
jgi:hypothetical protein